jgi:hypothetical protein
VGEEVVAQEERSLPFPLELFSSSANQESSKQQYREVLHTLLRHREPGCCRLTTGWTRA